MISFIKDALREFKTIDIPSKKETQSASMIILVSILIVAITVMFIDFLISKVIGLIFGF